MGQITFKEGGSIQFKGGTLTFLSYTPMPDPTVTVQWIYEAGQYKAKATIKNNHEYDAILRYTVTLGETVTSHVITLTGLDEFTPTFYNLSKSPDNGFLFKVEAFIEDDEQINPRPNSNTITKQTTSNFRVYYWNIGTATMQNTVAAYSLSVGSITPTTDYLELKAKAQTGSSAVRSVSTPYPINNTSVNKVVVEFDAKSGDGDRDSVYLARHSNYNTNPQSISTIVSYVFGSGTTSYTLSIIATAYTEYFIVYLYDDYTDSLDPELRIKKFYGEKITNGPLVE